MYKFCRVCHLSQLDPHPSPAPPPKVTWVHPPRIFRDHLERQGGLGPTGWRSVRKLSIDTSTKSKLIGKTATTPSFRTSANMTAIPLQARPQGITFDEYGRPFLILKEQDKQKRLTGLDAQKVKTFKPQSYLWSSSKFFFLLVIWVNFLFFHSLIF